MEVWINEDPPSKKKLPVVIYVPEFLVELVMSKDSTEVEKAVGEYALITLYYFLRVEEYFQWT